MSAKTPFEKRVYFIIIIFFILLTFSISIREIRRKVDEIFFLSY